MKRLLYIFFTILFTNLEASPCIGISTGQDYVGDREVAWRIKVAAERLGWTAIIDEHEGKKIRRLKDLDWVICLLPYNHYSNPHCPNFVSVFHPFNYLDGERKLQSFYDKYDGYLLTIPDTESIEVSLKERNKEFHFIPFYPTVYQVPYRQLALNNLVIAIPVWSNRVTDPKFRTLYTLLSNTGFVKFYGKQECASLLSSGYLGTIPFDGISFLNALQQHGIVLIMHSDIHNQECIPSARIFEAAAASTVIICDENPFVKKHFADSVFYIDTTLSAEEILNQIQEHMQTISLYPEKAWEMARRAHQIFTENFELSAQLLRLEAMHKEIIKKNPTSSKKKKKKPR